MRGNGESIDEQTHRQNSIVPCWQVAHEAHDGVTREGQQVLPIWFVLVGAYLQSNAHGNQVSEHTVRPNNRKLLVIITFASMALQATPALHVSRVLASTRSRSSCTSSCTPSSKARLRLNACLAPALPVMAPPTSDMRCLSDRMPTGGGRLRGCWRCWPDDVDEAAAVLGSTGKRPSSSMSVESLVEPPSPVRPNASLVSSYSSPPLNMPPLAPSS